MGGSDYRWSYHRAPDSRDSIVYFKALNEVGHHIAMEIGRWRREGYQNPAEIERVLYDYTEKMFRLSERLGCDGSVSDDTYREAARQAWPNVLRWFKGGMGREAKTMIRYIDDHALAYHQLLLPPKSKVSHPATQGRAENGPSHLFDPSFFAR